MGLARTMMGLLGTVLTTVTESPSGAEANPQYADNIKYLNLLSAEEFGATIEAFTYPDEFAQCDGTAKPAPGVAVGQQIAESSLGFAIVPVSVTMSMAQIMATSCI
jgi:hypothetical protein